MTTLRVVRGTPDDDELAAVIAAIRVVASRRNEAASQPASDRWRAALRTGEPPRGPGAWRSAVRPA